VRRTDEHDKRRIVPRQSKQGGRRVARRPVGFREGPRARVNLASRTTNARPRVLKGIEGKRLTYWPASSTRRPPRLLNLETFRIWIAEMGTA
jgi:hypothetical protein